MRTGALLLQSLLMDVLWLGAIVIKEAMRLMSTFELLQKKRVADLSMVELLFIGQVFDF